MPPRTRLDTLALACRVYPVTPELIKTHRARRSWQQPRSMLIFDTETRIDATQRLTFGSYRFLVDGVCLEEGLFYADDLPEADQAILRAYADAHLADVGEAGVGCLQLLTQRQFLDKVLLVGFKARGLVVGFHLAFDLSRLAHDSAEARGAFTGGFSLGLWPRDTELGPARHPFRPRVGIKQIDSKRALMGFTGSQRPSPVDRIGRVTISSPAVMRPFETLNAGKGYADQLKPFTSW